MIYLFAFSQVCEYIIFNSKLKFLFNKTYDWTDRQVKTFNTSLNQFHLFHIT